MSRKRDYLSPSQLIKWERDPEEYYLLYLAEGRVPRTPQTEPMAIGTAFDIEVKNSLHRWALLNSVTGALYPEAGKEDLVYERQIENPLWRGEMRRLGKVLLQSYKDSGAYTDLTMEIGSDLVMEGDGTGELEGLPGIQWKYFPDIRFRDAGGTPMVLDWKCNGYFSNSSVSPKPGFVKVRDGWIGGPYSRGNLTAHRDAKVVRWGKGGVVVNANKDQIDYDWHTQLCIYAVGCFGLDALPFVVGIEQLAFKTLNGVRLPRVASHRWTVTKTDIDRLYERVERMLEAIHSDWIFRHLTREDSKALVDELEFKASLGASAHLFS